MFHCSFLDIIFISYPVAVTLPIPQQRCLSICIQTSDIVPTTWKKGRLRIGSVYLIFYERHLKKNKRECSFSWHWIKKYIQQGATLETCCTHSSWLVYKVKYRFYYSENVKMPHLFHSVSFLWNAVCRWWWDGWIVIFSEVCSPLKPDYRCFLGIKSCRKV